MIKNQIIMDSGVDFNANLIEKELSKDIKDIKDIKDTEECRLVRVPFIVYFDKEEIIDKSANFNQVMGKIKTGREKISTACPSPHDFYEIYKKAENNIVITISSKLSGTYQSAQIAKDTLKEEGCENNVIIIDSKSASAGESLVALKVKELICSGIEKNQLTDEVNDYAKNLKTLFLPESISTLERSGRIDSFKAKVTKFLNITPILGSDGDGNITVKGKSRGAKKALIKVMNLISKELAKDPESIDDKILAISHVDTIEKAKEVKALLEREFRFKDIIIFEAGGLSSIYADEKGLVFAF